MSAIRGPPGLSAIASAYGGKVLKKLQKTVVFLILLALVLSFSLNLTKAEPLDRITPTPTSTTIISPTPASNPAASVPSPTISPPSGTVDPNVPCKERGYIAAFMKEGIGGIFDKPFQDMLCKIYALIVETIVLAADFTEHLMMGITPTSFENNIENIKEIWKMILSLVDYFVVFALIVIAFANILGIRLDTYAVKKTLPTLILAVVMANFSFFFSEILAEAASVLTDWQTELAKQATGGKMGDSLFGIFYRTIFYNFLDIKVNALDATKLVGAIIGITLVSGAWIVALITLIIVALIPIILMIIIFLLLMARNYVLYFLVIASPLAFVAMGFPMTQKYFQQWWSQFARWLFMAPLAFAMITLGILIGTKFGDVTKITAGKVVEGVNDAGLLPKYILMCLAAYFAIKLPFSLGGGVMGAWGGALKKAGTGLAKHGWNYGNDRLYEFTSRKGGMGWNLRDTPMGWLEESKRRTENIKTAAKGGGANLKEAGSELIPRFASGKAFKESIKAFKEGGGLGKFPGAAGGFLMSEERKNATIADQLKTYLNAGKGMENFPLESLYAGAQGAINRGDFKEASRLIAAMGTKHNRNLDPSKTNEIVHNYMSKFDKIGGGKFLDMLDHDISTNGGSDNNYLSNFFGRNKESYAHKWLQYNMRKTDAEQNAQGIIGRESELIDGDYKDQNNKISEFGNIGQSRVASARKFLAQRPGADPIHRDPALYNAVQSHYDKFDSLASEEGKKAYINDRLSDFIHEENRAAGYFISHLNSAGLLDSFSLDKRALEDQFQKLNISPNIPINPRVKFAGDWKSELSHKYIKDLGDQNALQQVTDDLDEITKVPDKITEITQEKHVKLAVKLSSDSGNSLKQQLQQIKDKANEEIKRYAQDSHLEDLNLATKLQGKVSTQTIESLQNLRDKIKHANQGIEDLVSKDAKKIVKQWQKISGQKFKP